MAYLVLARKYRPRQFSELVGQQHVATTLLNSFKQKKLGQSYLLTGTRGVGKTSVARIFAKALRCENPDSQPGEKNAGISCDKCPSCIDINGGASLDVLEIDGASNNGVENIREIREQVKFLPSRGKIKVYIVDEVHMLTNSAFNALLKTLEEPPAHVTFILATTEVQKIPATILSRCQRFDFRRVPLPLIQEHLSRILGLEEISAELPALRLIAKKADGSIRDALSALDQCLALGGKKIDVPAVSDALGIVSDSFLINVLRFTFQEKIVEAASLLQQAFLSGIEMKLVTTGLAETLRNALFVKLGAEEALTDVSPEERKEFEELVRNVSSETIQAAFRLMHGSLDEILRSPLPKASLEMAIARMAGLGKLKTLGDLVFSLQTGGSASAPPMENPTLEKKSPPPTKMQATHPVAAAGFESFMAFVLQKKASLGAVLEHSIALEPQAWAKGTEIRIGFRKNHSFYQMQAQQKGNFESLEKYLQEFLSRNVKLKIETLTETAAPTASSLVEKEKEIMAKTISDRKKLFLEKDIVRDTKEIFGAELSSFDIDKSKI